MTKKQTNRGNLVAQIEAILTTEIPGTPKLNLRKAARDINRLLQTEIRVPSEVPATAELAKRIMSILQAEVPYTPKVGPPLRHAFTAQGRVEYHRLKGSIKELSARARQVIEALDKHQGHGTSADLQKWLKVNRNVIAGALHELRQAHLIRAERLAE